MGKRPGGHAIAKGGTMRGALRSWCALWGVPDPAERLRLLPSSRLRTSLARCRPDRAEIRIALFVLEGPAALRDEVLCHEAAHAAVAHLHGKRPF